VKCNCESTDWQLMCFQQQRSETNKQATLIINTSMCTLQWFCQCTGNRNI